MRLFIVAGDYQQAVHWAREWGLEPPEWRYVTNQETLLGTHGARYALAGTWYERSDWPQIRARLASVRAVDVTLETER